jgi:hypothetical protein
VEVTTTIPTADILPGLRQVLRKAVAKADRLANHRWRFADEGGRIRIVAEVAATFVEWSMRLVVPEFPAVCGLTTDDLIRLATAELATTLS